MASNGTLDERYLNWLYKQTGPVKQRNPARSYWSLSVQLYQKRFVWFVPNDDNRVADGKDLRAEFVELHMENPPMGWLEEDCSVLEMLIALSRRAAFEAEGTPYDWYWQFLTNLGLRAFTDNQYSRAVEEGIDDVLNTWINRQYTRNGDGGLFPLTHPARDQRRVEIWYQMASYLLENDSV